MNVCSPVDTSTTRPDLREVNEASHPRSDLKRSAGGFITDAERCELLLTHDTRPSPERTPER